jgi:uncharacterized protein YndB with AHSA1/START domain
VPRTSVSRAIPAAQHDVWALLSDIANARRWNKTWKQIEITSPQTHGAGTTFRAHTDDEHVFDFEVSEWIAPELISFSPIRDRRERYAITLDSHTFQLRPLSEEDTEVELTARASAHGVRGRFIALFFWSGFQKQGLETALDALEEVFAPTADEPAPEGQANAEPAPEAPTAE